VSELLTADQFIHQALVSDPGMANLVGARVYRDIVPPEGSYPCVLFTCLAARDVNGAGACRIAVNALYRVVAIGRGNGGRAIDPISEQFDSLLQGARVALMGGTVFSCVREEPVARPPEVVEGKVYYQRGGDYRILISGYNEGGLGMDTWNTTPFGTKEQSLRVGGSAIAMDGLSSGSFAVSGGTRFSVRANMRTTIAYLIIGYSTPIGLANASVLQADLNVFEDNVEDGTTVYWATLDPSDLSPIECGANDFLYVSIYE